MQYTGKEFKVIALREVPLPDQMSLCDCPAKSAEYWREVIEKDVRHSGEVESFYVLLLNTRRRVIMGKPHEGCLRGWCVVIGETHSVPYFYASERKGEL